ncbi:threonine/homoserine/homoserine lactone efflux protein [Rhodopirellula rubra]|uniref:Threonine/homoserine/homoserine lactone efflux protein n=1 Tax=Aporhodopirellula rubra TaxID=980271 RepID=A0A7W5E240_9BACT|nr:hypothetical protein [Aporhodopirellula rubra]MBB3207887.1 threonine/homoserine/homoserine lactone efflux protein [Aporhodopirellula rubra]
MLSFESLLGFVVATVLLALAAGLDNVFVLAQSAMSGLPARLLVTDGLCTGVIVHAFAVAIGVVTLICASTWSHCSSLSGQDTRWISRGCRFA